MPKIKKSFVPSLLTKAYWYDAVHHKNKTLFLCVLALMMALGITISAFFIPVGDNLRIYFSFIPKAIACAIGGPVVALCYGFCSDILGFIIHPSGAFFPGYILSSMLGCLIYALFLFHQRITIVKLFLCKLFVNVFVNLCLGSLWSSMLSGKGYYYYFAKSVIKNTLMLPLEVLLLYVIFQALLPTLCKMKLISTEQKVITFI